MFAMDHLEEDSDDEVFIGDLTLKEVKKRLLFNDSVQCSAQKYLTACNIEEDHDKSVRIIETHSTPNIISSSISQVDITKHGSSPNLSVDVTNGNWDMSADDSFLRLEKLVSAMCTSPKKDALDNTEEVVEFILKTELREDENQECSNKNQTSQSELTELMPIPQNIEDHQTPPKIPNIIQTCETPFTIEEPNTPLSSYSTPAKNIYNVKQGDIFATPSNELQKPAPVFKTPGNPVSHKKPGPSSNKKTFEHILSPVALYIKNSPSVPLIKNVCPKKPLRGASCIPKLVKSAKKDNVVNKENTTKLPSIAYKNAKETKVIEIPDKGKMPQNQWAKQVASSIPRAMIMKHDRREVIGNKKPLTLTQQQESSFADLSLHQADLSLCTQQSAVKMPKNKLLK